VRSLLTINSRQGGDGWFGTVGAGYDMQFNSSWVAGVLVDGDEAIHTTHGFLVYPIATLGAGAVPIIAAEREHTADVDAEPPPRSGIVAAGPIRQAMRGVHSADPRYLSS